MNVPANFKYTKDHEWISVEGDIATVGITDFAQGELGDIVYVEIETEGETLDQEEVFGSVEAVKTVSDLFMPVSGEIIEFNSLSDLKKSSTSVVQGKIVFINQRMNDSEINTFRAYGSCSSMRVDGAVEAAWK